MMGESKIITILDSSSELPVLLYRVRSRALIFPLYEKPT